MKWILRLLVLVVVVLAVAVASLFLVPADRIARVATDQLSAAMGREVAINGDVGFTIWPVLGVRASGLELGNAQWSDQGPMFEAATAAIGVDAMALLTGEIRVTNLEAENPTVRLEVNDAGRANWEFSDTKETAEAATIDPQAKKAQTESAPANTASASGAISVQQIKITNATLTYSAAGDAPISLSGVDLNLDWPDPLGTAEIAASLKPAKETVTLDAAIDGFASFVAGKTQTFRVSLATDDATLSFDGKGSTAGAVAGQFALKSPDTDGFLNALGLPAADLPETLGRQIDMTTALTLTPDLKLSLRDLIVDLGGNKISGAADVELTEVPLINAQFDVGDFDLTFEGASGAKPSPAEKNTAKATNASERRTDVSATGWPKSTIDASGLAAFDGEIALSANSIDLGQFKVGATQAILRNKRSRMVFDLRNVDAYGGTVTGEFVINNRSGLSVRGGIAAKSIQMQALLTDAADINRLTGQGDMQLAFLGSGASVDAIMRSLSGDGSLSIGRGTIQGIDLDRLMRSGDSSGGTTVFDSLGATWTISSGVLSNDDLRLQLKNYEATGKGVVGLGAQTVNYTATPVALRANSGQGVSIPVHFKGPWADVSIRPDLEAAFGAELDAQADELEKKAKEKLTKELGVETQDGQSTEDAVKEKLLRKLFD